MKFLTSREFNRDVSYAKREARVEPVLITDRGQPTHVLMSIEDFRRFTGEGESILELLAMPAVTPQAAEQAIELDASDASDGAWDHREGLG
ncbi:MAG: prevent-host-death protein [Burkholderiales bacterium PBB3]|nr:MAG: prevent-host-death protein [Burkholderiales bacterium PBB3]